ncbi:MAG: 3-hydroxyacyl-CoA dehydrogenase NAD-binding domain-containing protein [Gammaproteobacteria bacterium]
MSDPIDRVACIGTGTVGAGWAALFLARGYEVRAWDPAPDGEAAMRRAIERAWPALTRLGLSEGTSPDRIEFLPALDEAVGGAAFVQESAPDNEELKIELLSKIDAACDSQAVIASSSSTFLPSRLAARCRYPQRIVVGHPFVPVYLVPLVEVVGGERTSEGALERAFEFYASLGMAPLKLKREIEGYLANRLQRALFEEACSLVEAGVCDWDDVENAVTLGPGFRWPVVGPVLHRHLGGGLGGIRHMIEHFGWRGPEGGDKTLIDAVEKRWAGWTIEALADRRDAQLLGILQAMGRRETQ